MFFLHRKYIYVDVRTWGLCVYMCMCKVYTCTKSVISLFKALECFFSLLVDESKTKTGKYVHTCTYMYMHIIHVYNDIIIYFRWSLNVYMYIKKYGSTSYNYILGSLLNTVFTILHLHIQLQKLR